MQGEGINTKKHTVKWALLRKPLKIFKRTKTVQSGQASKCSQERPKTSRRKKDSKNKSLAAYSRLEGSTVDLCFAICAQSQHSAFCKSAYPRSHFVSNISYLPGTRTTCPINAKLKQQVVPKLLSLQWSTTERITPHSVLQIKYNRYSRLQ